MSSFDPVEERTSQQIDEVLLEYAAAQFEEAEVELGSEIEDLVNAIAMQGALWEVWDELVDRATRKGGL